MDDATNSVVAKCVTDDGTSATGGRPTSTTKAKAALWHPVVGAMGMIIPTFAERFPDCLRAGKADANAAKIFASIESWDALEYLVLDRAAGGNSAKWNQADPAWLVAGLDTVKGL